MQRTRRWLLGVLVATLFVTPTAAAVSIQESLLRAKPAVALVIVEVSAAVTLTCPGRRQQTVTPPHFRETTTGWFVDASGWLVTNAHAVSPAHKPPEWLLNDQAQKAARSACGETQGPTAARTAKVKVDPTISVMLSNGIRLAATVAKYSPTGESEVRSGRDLALLRIEAADMPTLALGESSNLKIGDRIHILGFPDVVLSHELLNASAKAEASVTSGAISGFKQDRAGQTVIQTDAPSALGNGGGPAVGDEGRVVGVLTFVTEGSEGDVVQGFNFVIPVQAVREFLTGTEAKPDQPGNFDRAWQAGLREFFAGNYAAAERPLADANRLLPELPDVKRIAVENLEKIKHPPPRPFPWTSVAIGVTVVSVGVCGNLWLVRWRRNQFRIRPAEVAKLIESSPQPPMILDVRDRSTYDRSPVRIRNARHVAPDQLDTGMAALTIEPERTVVAYCT